MNESSYEGVSEYAEETVLSLSVLQPPASEGWLMVNGYLLALE